MGSPRNAPGRRRGNLGADVAEVKDAAGAVGKAPPSGGRSTGILASRASGTAPGVFEEAQPHIDALVIAGDAALAPWVKAAAARTFQRRRNHLVNLPVAAEIDGTAAAGILRALHESRVEVAAAHEDAVGDLAHQGQAEHVAIIGLGGAEIGAAELDLEQRGWSSGVATSAISSPVPIAGRRRRPDQPASQAHFPGPCRLAVRADQRRGLAGRAFFQPAWQRHLPYQGLPWAPPIRLAFLRGALQARLNPDRRSSGRSSCCRGRCGPVKPTRAGCCWSHASGSAGWRAEQQCEDRTQSGEPRDGTGSHSAHVLPGGLSPAGCSSAGSPSSPAASAGACRRARASGLRGSAPPAGTACRRGPARRPSAGSARTAPRCRPCHG